jgi:hypothetical protein
VGDSAHVRERTWRFEVCRDRFSLKAPLKTFG